MKWNFRIFGEEDENISNRAFSVLCSSSSSPHVGMSYIAVFILSTPTGYLHLLLYLPSGNLIVNSRCSLLEGLYKKMLCWWLKVQVV
jgi:hypothetical protein